jgi:hypothetical protein
MNRIIVGRFVKLTKKQYIALYNRMISQ